jgi:Fur family transcriptional regulator, iron response regulator
LTNCLTSGPVIAERLKQAGLRPTKQRVALGALLFGAGNRHVTAEMLHDEAVRDAILVSLATVYNTLHQFTEAGLLREVAIEGAKTYFDTNTSDHYHFYFEHNGALMDAQSGTMPDVSLLELPAGMRVSRIDVLVRLVRIESDSGKR